jgi:hypothetical protein
MGDGLFDITNVGLAERELRLYREGKVYVSEMGERGGPEKRD